MTTLDRLSDEDRAMLDFAALSWRSAGLKEQAIRAQFGVSATRYYQRLSGLLDNPAAVMYAPVTVNRLRRVRERRSALRSRTRTPEGVAASLMDRWRDQV